MNSVSCKRSYLSRLQIGFYPHLQKSELTMLSLCLWVWLPNWKEMCFVLLGQDLQKAIFLHAPVMTKLLKNVTSWFLSFSHLFTDKYVFFLLHVYAPTVTFNGQGRLITGGYISPLDIASYTAFTATYPL